MNGETLIIVGIGIALCIFIGVILIVVGRHDYNEANRGTEIGLGISLIIVPILATLMYFAYGDSDSSEQDKAISKRMKTVIRFISTAILSTMDLILTALIWINTTSELKRIRFI